MVLSDTQVAKFQELYKKEFDIDLSYEEAYQQGMKLLNLVRIVYQPISKEDFEKLEVEHISNS